jgi:SpoVK/Ycf46/Vps4 family AAA+-type ATPase
MFADIVGLEDLKQDMIRDVVMPLKQPKLYASTASTALLYGPPGNGKTVVAKAAANEAGVSFVLFECDKVKDSYLGQSEKNLVSVFQHARDKKPSILFLDEVDNLMGKKSGRDDATDTTLKNLFLTQIDGASVDNTGVFIVAATNHPWSLEPAFVSRFGKKFLVPYFTEVERALLIRLEVERQLEPKRTGQCTITNGEYEQLAKQTEWFSGRKIHFAVKDALTKPMNEHRMATHFRLDDDGKWLMCDALHPNATAMNADEMYEKYEDVCKFPPVAYEHVRIAVAFKRSHEVNIPELKDELEQSLAYGGGNGGGGAGGSTGDDAAEQARQEQERLEHERLEQERVRQEQERQEQAREELERARQEQEREELERVRQERERQEQEQERVVQEQERAVQELARQEQERLVQEQARIAQERVLQEQEQTQARDAMQVRTQVIRLYKPMFLHTTPIIR